MSADPLAWLRSAATDAEVPPAPVRQWRPERITGPLGWAADAACFGMDTGRFYDPAGIVDAEMAAACRGCPVLAECRDHALHHEDHGYWAGMSERARRSLRRSLGITVATRLDTTEEAP